MPQWTSAVPTALSSHVESWNDGQLATSAPRAAPHVLRAGVSFGGVQSCLSISRQQNSLALHFVLPGLVGVSVSWSHPCFSLLYRASVKNQLVLTSDMSPGAASMTSGEQPVKRAVTGDTAGHTDGKNSKPKPM